MSLRLYQINPECQHYCVVVGLGLIGQQIDYFLNLRNRLIPQASLIKTSWQDPGVLCATIEKLIAENQIKKLDVIWSAGKGGFSASDQDMETEFTFFSVVVSYLKVLDVHLVFNLLSSAGGIYESTSYVEKMDNISPARPYACWKLKQEDCLRDEEVSSRIYRVSSAFGYKNKSGRQGMINALIECALLSKPAMIYASQNTLRDYIFIDDLARYLVENINSEVEARVEILASGRPASINMLLNMVANVTRKPMKAIYVDSKTNSNDIVFNKAIVPPTLVKTSLEEGIRLLYSRAVSN